MKKYDLYIVGAYIVVIVVAIVSARGIYNEVKVIQANAKELVSSPADSVVIKDFDLELKIIRTDNKELLSRGNWGGSSQIYMENDGLDFFKVKDKVLYIGSFDGRPVTGIASLSLYVSRDMPVKMINSPNVVLSSEVQTYKPAVTTYHGKNGDEIEKSSNIKD